MIGFAASMPHALPPDTHAEVISAMRQAADLYAFGVLLWELYHGMRAWEGYNHAQVGAVSLPSISRLPACKCAACRPF
jgi:hypothetical protein